MLDTADRKALRARAHHLDPVIMIGEAGLTRAVLDETDRALRAHELIKVRVLGDDREQRQAMSTEICSALGCTAVQSIGKLLVLYRPRPIEDPRDEPHVPKKRAAQGLGRAKKGASVKTGKTTKRAAKGGAAKGGAAKGGGTSAGSATKRATNGKRATTREAGARTAAKRSAEEQAARPSRVGGANAGSGARAVAQRSAGARPAAKRTGRTTAATKAAGASGKQGARSAGRTNARATGRTDARAAGRTDAQPAGRTSTRSAGSTSTRQSGRTKKS